MLQTSLTRFQIMCPKCHDLNEVSFDTVVVGGWGSTIHFKCVECNTQHMLGGIPEYREIEKNSRFYLHS